MWIIQIENFGAELKPLEFLDLSIYFFHTLDRIQPNSQLKHMSWCLLLPMQSS